MKRILLFCLFVSFCSLWAIQPKDSSPADSIQLSKPTFNARLTIGKGIFENDSRYTGAVTTADSVTHAFAGSDITYNISVDAKGYKLRKGAINFGDTIVPAKITGDTLLTSTYRIKNKAKKYDKVKVETVFKYSGEVVVEKDSTITMTDFLGLKYDTVISYLDTIIADIDTTFIYQIPKSQSFVLYDMPKLSKIKNDTIKINELDSCKMELIADVKGGNISKWEYEWITDISAMKDTISKTMIDSTIIIGKDLIYKELVRHEVEGDTMKIDELKYRLRYCNIAPDDTTVWYKDSVLATTIRIYNSPKPAKSIECIKNGKNAVYIPTGFIETDEELQEKYYKFVFNDKDTLTNRYLINPTYTLEFVRTLWEYEDFYCCSDTTMYDSSHATELSYEIALAVNKGLLEKEQSYTGAVTTGNGVTHALSGSEINYKVFIDPMGGKLLKGSFLFGDKEEVAKVNLNFLNLTSIINEPGTYDNITINAVIRFTIDNNQSFDFNTSFAVPMSKTFVLYPMPVYPQKISDYKKQFAYNDELSAGQNTQKIGLDIIPAEGGNNNWQYVWTNGYNNTLGTGQSLEEIDLSNMFKASIIKKAVSEIIYLQYTDIAPNGKAWISGTIEYPIRIYNTPSSPVSFKPKGITNTSNIYIAMMDETSFTKNNMDKVVESRDYTFVYGNDEEVIMEKNSTELPKECRWCNYSGLPHNNPWVETIWRYPASGEFSAFECRSTRCYANGSRGNGEGTTSIENIESGQSIYKIYTLEGTIMNVSDIKSLSSGVYIIENAQNGQVLRNKIIVK